MSRVALSRIAGGLVMLAACLFGVEAWISSDSAFVENTVRSNLSLNADFASAAAVVDRFYEEHQRFPGAADPPGVSGDQKLVLLYAPLRTQQDLKSIPSGAQVVSFEINATPSTFPAQVRSEFPPAPAGGHPYLLVDHTVEQPRIWASWVGRSDALTDAAHFYFLGSSFADTLVFAIIAGALGTVGVLLLRGPRAVG